MDLPDTIRIFPRTLQSRNVVYYYRYRYDDGRRSPAYSLRTSDPEKAVKNCKKLFESGKLYQHSNVSFKLYTKDFFSETGKYAKWKKASGNPVMANTLRQYISMLNNQLLPFFSDYSITKISVQAVKDWRIWADDQWASKTINDAQGVLSIILGQAVDENIISFSPTERVGYKKLNKNSKQLLTIPEMNTLYHMKWKDNQNLAFLIACVTGMRIGEVCALKKSDLHGTYLDVVDSYNPTFGMGKTKTKACRKVPIPDGLADKLSRISTEFLIPYKDGLPMHSNCILNSMKRRCGKIGIDVKARKITVHSLRNSFISHMIGRNFTKEKVRAVVGHKDKDITDSYTYWSMDMLEDIRKEQNLMYNDIVYEGVQANE